MQVLQSKLRRPQVSQSVLDRTWLFRRPLTRAPDTGDGGTPAGTSVTVLSAPAGTGKTTVMSTWARDRAEQGARVAWVALDGGDNDPDTFWATVTEAVRGALSTPSGEAVDPPQTGAGSWRPPPAVRLELLIAQVPGPLWLFLDDLQEVDNPEVLAGLDAVVRRPPDGLHLVLATRRDPALSLHRWRLSGGLREIRAADLALDADEVRRILGQHGVEVTDDDLRLLVGRTEGWAAGIRLAALTLADAPDPHVVVQRFAGDERQVADYLATEVVAGLGDSERRLLRLCAVPEQLTAELAVALTGDPAAEDVLERLHRSNVLVVRLTETEDWYRMHALLRSHLLAGLRRSDPQELAAAHRRTALWLAGHGHLAWAIGHALQAGDPALATEMLTAHGPTLLADGRGQVLHRLIRSGPAELLGDPAVARLAVLAALEVEDTPATATPPAAVDGGPSAPRSDPLDALVALQQARHHLALSPAVLAATAGMPDVADPDLRLLLLLVRARVQYLSGRLEEAGAGWQEAAELARHTRNGHALVGALTGLTALATTRGRFDAAWALAEEAIRVAARLGPLRGPDVGAVLVMAARCARQRLDGEGARHLAARAAVILDDSPNLSARLSIRWLRAVVDLEAGGDPLEAARHLTASWALAGEERISPLVAIHLAFHQHRCAWLAGRPDWAAEALAHLAEHAGPGGELATLQALEHLARGRHDAARARVAPVVDGRLRCLMPIFHLQAWLLEAQLATTAGQSARSHEALQRALQMAGEMQALRGFLDVPGIPALLDEQAGRFGRLDPLVERIRAASRTRPDHPFVPMTPRELALLTDLPAQLTLEEIAARQQVSVNTVKTHVRSIYQKLGASSRRDAIATARRRGLL
ncbi:LuxR C-terminal-related transcriptional regulator [Geodermatophilus sp. SYSU D00710]